MGVDKVGDCETAKEEQEAIKRAELPKLSRRRLLQWMLVSLSPTLINACSKTSLENPAVDESNDSFAQRESATKNTIAKHDDGLLGKVADLKAATETFFSEASAYAKDLEEHIPSYRDTLLTALEGSKNDLHALTVFFLPEKAEMRQRSVFDRDIATCIETLKNGFPDLIKTLFIWTGTLFNTKLQREFLEGLHSNALTKERFWQFLTDGADPNQRAIKDSFIIAGRYAEGDFLARFLLPAILYFIGLDLVPSLNKTLGGRIRANYAALMTALTATPPGFYPEITQITKDAGVFTQTPLGQTIGIAALIMSQPIIGTAELSIEEKMALLGGEEMADLPEKLQAVFNELIAYHRSRLERLEKEGGDSALQADTLFQTYFDDGRPRDGSKLIRSPGNEQLVNMQEAGGKKIVEILGWDHRSESKRDSITNALFFYGEILTALFFRDPDKLEARVCRRTFRHPIDRDKPPGVTTVGMPLPPEITCMTYHPPLRKL